MTMTTTLSHHGFTETVAAIAGTAEKAKKTTTPDASAAEMHHLGHTRCVFFYILLY
jgi:hypothetical protein